MPDIPATLAAALRDRYLLERELGHGGMATVYLAQDLKHHRRVAIKVLHPDLAGALGAERFLREIATVAALRHPHIIPLYDSGEISEGQPSAEQREAEGPSFLYQVMPLVEGESLRDRLRRERQLPVADALRIGAEVADALAYAHAHGVVHRDVKPENILIESGHAVVADFGIARAIDAAGGASLTGTGLAIGTPPYMSPEQLEGARDLDGRSDVYALGCVMYEMLAGEPPFTGPTLASVAHQHLTAEPRPVAQLRPGVPAEIADVVTRALAKLPADRWRSAEEMHARLDALRTHSGEMSAPRKAAAPERARHRWLLLAGAVLALAAVAFAATRFAQRGAPAVVIGRRSQVTLAPGLEVHPALSPDGNLLAYVTANDARLLVRQVDGGTAIPVATTLPGPQAWPAWSPDGKQLAFASTRGVEVVAALGGVPRLLVPAPPGTATRDGIVVVGPWSPDGREVSFVRGDTLYAAPATAGTPRAIATAPRLHSCAWAPNGQHIACVSGNFESMTIGPLLGNVAQSDILIMPAAGGRPTPLVSDGAANASPAWLPDGTLLFVSNRDGGRDAYALRVNAQGRAAGVPHRVTLGLNALSITLPARGSRIGYATFEETSNVWAIDIPPGTSSTIDKARQVTAGRQIIEWFDISRDGRWLVFDSDRSGNTDVYRQPLGERREPEQLTKDPRDEFYPNVSPDGSEIVFHSFRDGHRQLFVMPSAGGAAQPVARTDDDERTPMWTPDGNGILALSNFGAPTMETHLYRRTANNGWSGPTRWRKPGCMPSWSPDGRLVACGGITGRLLLTNGTGDSLRVLVDSGLVHSMGIFPQWSSDARTVYYLQTDSAGMAVYAVPVDGGTPRRVLRFDDPARPWHRFGFRVFNDVFYFTVGDRESHIWVAELGAREGRGTPE